MSPASKKQHPHPPLNETQARVRDILTSAKKPLSAYEILDHMRKHGSVTPPTIYRSLDRLIEKGFVHRVELLNAYVACRHSHPTERAAFAICERCGSVTEFTEAAIDKHISHWAKKNEFQPKSLVLEIQGLCKACVA